MRERDRWIDQRVVDR
jgi:hypothetical protein